MEHTFHEPGSVDEAVQVLAAHDEKARLLAGGATLVAMMNAGLLETSALISLSAIEELTQFVTDSDGNARIGAMRRDLHHAVARVEQFGTTVRMRWKAFTVI